MGKILLPDQVYEENFGEAEFGKRCKKSGNQNRQQILVEDEAEVRD